MIEAELPVAQTQELNNKPAMQVKPEDKDALDRKQSLNSKKASSSGPFTTPKELADKLEY